MTPDPLPRLGADARALVTDPAAAAAAGEQRRRIAWAILKSERGERMIQHRVAARRRNPGPEDAA